MFLGGGIYLSRMGGAFTERYSLGYSLKPGGPFLWRYAYDKVFSYSLKQMELFQERTSKIAAFHRAAKDEKYDVFLLR